MNDKKLIEDFVEQEIVGYNILDAEDKLKSVGKNVWNYDGGVEDVTVNGEYIYYKSFEYILDDKTYDVILYYCDDEVTDYMVRRCLK